MRKQVIFAILRFLGILLLLAGFISLYFLPDEVGEMIMVGSILLFLIGGGLFAIIGVLVLSFWEIIEAVKQGGK